MSFFGKRVCCRFARPLKLSPSQEYTEFEFDNK